ncbi:MAG: DUF4350 domain-containing protein [Pseudomonadota bacterium]
MNQRTNTASPFSAKLVGLMIAVGLFGFMAVTVLTAWSPELRDKNRAGLHPYSTSALGYGGIVRLLEERGDPVSVSRFDRDLEDYTEALKVLTLTPFGMQEALEDLDLRGNALIILPKRSGTTDPVNPKWQSSVWYNPESSIAALLNPFDTDASIWQVRAPAYLEAEFGRFKPAFDGDIQLIRSDRLEPVMSTAAGMVVAQVPDRDIFILSDPDLVNTIGLGTFERARFATALLDWLRYDNRQTPIVFDATLHGFEQAQSVLQMMFDVPFLGATLIVVAVFLMFGWAGFVRFGAPEPEGRAIALGKEALTDSTAGLITMTGRERRLAPGYLALTRRAASRAIAAPRTLTDDQLNDLLERVSPKDGQGFIELADATANPATSREDLLIKARRLFQWRKETSHGH